MSTAITATRQRLQGFEWRIFFQRYGLVLSFFLLCLALHLTSDRFLQEQNLLNVLRQSSINAIISIGMMMVILTRGIDLSVGSILALATVITADMLKPEIVEGQVVRDAWALLPALLLCLALGAGLGLISGVLVSWIRIPPFIATLGMMTAARGLALYYTEGRPITGFGKLGEGFRTLGSGYLGPVPMPIIIAGIVFLVAYVLLYHTPLGRYIFAVGDNERAAYVSGLPVKPITMFVYAVSGMMAALAGAILIGRLNSAQPTAGEGFEFDAIAAVVVGGTSFEGGEGSVLGTLIGVLIIGVLNNGLNLLDVPSFYQDVVKGAVIALALLLHRAIR